MPADLEAQARWLDHLCSHLNSWDEILAEGEQIYEQMSPKVILQMLKLANCYADTVELVLAEIGNSPL